MNCQTCNQPALMLFPGGRCAKCHAAQPAAAPKPSPPRDRSKKPLPHRPRIFCSNITPDEYHGCIACGKTMIPKENEYPSHYRRRHTCSRECMSAAISAVQIGRWKTDERRPG